jgi:hypothetical protein
MSSYRLAPGVALLVQTALGMTIFLDMKKAGRKRPEKDKTGLERTQNPAKDAR